MFNKKPVQVKKRRSMNRVADKVKGRKKRMEVEIKLNVGRKYALSLLFLVLAVFLIIGVNAAPFTTGKPFHQLQQVIKDLDDFPGGETVDVNHNGIIDESEAPRWPVPASAMS